MRISEQARVIVLVTVFLGVVMSRTASTSSKQMIGSPTFGDDAAFLKKHTQVIVLSDAAGRAQVAVAPAYQGRVMTSTTDGPQGISHGWVNRELISAGKPQPHINVYGGEDRFWMGPEGGQFSIFFAPGVPFDLEHWFTPAPIDTEPFSVVESNRSRAVFGRKFRLNNYSRTAFDVDVTREVRLLDVQTAWTMLGMKPPPEVRTVAFESVNTLRNAGGRRWDKQTGLLSIWILGMFNASPATTIAIPFETGPEAKLGPIVNDAYFGKVPAGRLKIGKGLLFFSADANYRSKIGLSPARSKSLAASCDVQNGVLTIVQYTKPAGVTEYVNSMWEIQKQPFSGDVVNSYNDGAPSPGAKQLGRFYELETSSPALALTPNQTATHVHRTFHLRGPESALNEVAKKLLGVTFDQIGNGLKR